MNWPTSPEDLAREQLALAGADPPPWQLSSAGRAIGGCFVCFPRGFSGEGAAGDEAWAGASVLLPAGRVVTALATGAAGAPYRAGFLALREGPLLEAAVRGLARLPEVLLVNATGRDHPRRAGLALHLGAMLDLPTVGVTHRPLVAGGDWPAPARGAMSPLVLAEERVGFWLCTADGTRPLAVHAAWRTDPATAVEVVMASGGPGRTPEPLRQARRVAREARTEAARRRAAAEDPRGDPR